MTEKKDSWIANILLSIVTASVLGCFAFLWNLNSVATILKDHDLEKQNMINDLNLKMNNLQLNVQEVKERVIRIEAQNKQNPN